MKCINPIYNSVSNVESNYGVKQIDIERYNLYLSCTTTISYFLSLFLFKDGKYELINFIILIIIFLLLSLSFITIYRKRFNPINSIVFSISEGLFYGLLGSYLKNKLSVLRYNDQVFINDDSIIFITIFSSIILTSAIYSVYYYFFSSIKSFYYVYAIISLLSIILFIILIYILSNIYQEIDLIKNNLAIIITTLLISYILFFYHEEARKKVQNNISNNDVLKLSSFINSSLIYFPFELVNILFTKNDKAKK